jgi:hypothetical protein
LQSLGHDRFENTLDESKHWLVARKGLPMRGPAGFAEPLKGLGRAYSKSHR